MAVMPAKRREVEYPYDVRSRLSAPQYALLLVVAEERDCGISEALRFVLDDVMSGGKIAKREGINLLKLATTVEPDPLWERRHGAADAS